MKITMRGVLDEVSVDGYEPSTADNEREVRVCLYDPADRCWISGVIKGDKNVVSGHWAELFEAKMDRSAVTVTIEVGSAPECLHSMQDKYIRDDGAVGCHECEEAST